MTPTVGQTGRLFILIAYVVGLLGMVRVVHGQWLPPTTEQGLWFYSALAALLLGSLLVTPFYTKPADAMSYGVAALIPLLAVDPPSSQTTIAFDRLAWHASIGYTVFVVSIAAVGIATKDSSWSRVRHTSRIAELLLEAIGTPRAVFSVVFLFALVTYHRSTPDEFLPIALAWIVFIGLRPLETAVLLWKRFRRVWHPPVVGRLVGEIVGHEAPGLVLINERSETNTKFGSPLAVRSDTGRATLAYALDHVGYSDGKWLRAMDAGIDLGDAYAESGAVPIRQVVGGMVYDVLAQGLSDDVKKSQRQVEDRLIGFVAPDTTLGQIQIEFVRNDLDLREGTLVEVEIRNGCVLYQVIEGVTKEELLREKNRRGFVRATAKKVGRWDPGVKKLVPVPWMPLPNQAVYLKGSTKGELPIESDAIGRLPGVGYSVQVDASALVTHNTAILGILGIGKSFLAFELIERLLAAGINIVCLDVTGQYGKELASFVSPQDEKDNGELVRLGPPGRTKVSRNVDEGGSVADFRGKVKEQLRTFLATDSGLKIINPNGFEVWRQDSKPYQGAASMATLTPVEITRIVTETLLEVLQEEGIAERARCCVVYEEAHSLVPEWNAVASDGDRAATSGTAKAILQGRKYGLGCLLITQRTANVTKSILNQCNTLFAFRVFDATGMEFLRNYIGDDYASVLSTLPERHAVLFGRASSCADPVMLSLNTRSEFIQAFRPKPEGAVGA